MPGSPSASKSKHGDKTGAKRKKNAVLASQLFAISMSPKWSCMDPFEIMFMSFYNNVHEPSWMSRQRGGQMPVGADSSMM